ncbi:MAG TPA: biotin/lipoyl-containing protein [Candidatus Eisenbacteria bacterium]|nr:biotin/lipoyl-containing protein [Candidatus Eisenbacteria bacterium]
MEQRIACGGIEYRLIKGEGDTVSVSQAEGDAQRFRIEMLPGGTFMIEGPKGRIPGDAVRDGSKVWVYLAGRTYRFDLVRPNRGRTADAHGDLSSPMPGQVQKLLVVEGDAVQAGQALLVVEAMKMQLEIKAPHPGRVRRLLAREGQQVEAGVPLVELDAAVAPTAKPGKRSK